MMKNQQLYARWDMREELSQETKKEIAGRIKKIRLDMEFDDKKDFAKFIRTL